LIPALNELGYLPPGVHAASLDELQEQIAHARSRAQTPENAESLQSRVRTADQLREEIVRYQSAHRRQAS